MRDDLHPCPFSDITMLLRKQGRGVPHPGPTIMLKLYFVHHTLTFHTVWDLFRGNHLTFERDGGRRGGIGYFFMYILQTDLEEKKFLKGNTWRKEFQKNMFHGV